MTSSQDSAGFYGTDRMRAAALEKAGTRLGTTPPTHRRHDRHGRGVRGPVFFPSLPAWRTRREDFYLLAQDAITVLSSRCPAVETIEFGVEEVPPSDPADWESSDVSLARTFPRDPRRGLKDRIVLYRLPILQRASTDTVPAAVITILAHRISEVLDVSPQDLLGEIG